MSSQTNLSRRRFGGLLAATLGATGTPAWAAAAQGKGKRMQQQHALIKPARLRDGDLVAIIAPGGFTDEDAIAKAQRNIESLGLRASLGANIRAVHGNYAGTVQQRLDDLHAAFADPEVKAIWAIRGGSGCIVHAARDSGARCLVSRAEGARHQAGRACEDEEADDAAAGDRPFDRNRHRALALPQLGAPGIPEVHSVREAVGREVFLSHQAAVRTPLPVGERSARSAG